MSTLLSAIRALVLRPLPQGAQLCAQIQAQGGYALSFPVISFAPPVDSNALANAIAQFAAQDEVIFISPQAVKAALPLIKQQWPQFPPHLTIFALGPGTRSALIAAGHRKIVMPLQQWDSEGLLALPALQHLQGRNIMLVSGDQGRALLGQTLQARGAHVTYLRAYQRILTPSLARLSPAQHLAEIKNHAINVIISTSSESVEYLLQLFDAVGRTYLKSLALIVVSHRMKILAQHLGFQTIWVAQNASHQAIIQLLAQSKEIQHDRAK